MRCKVFYINYDGRCFGLLLLFVTLASGWISRLSLSFAVIYLVVGIILGPYGFGLIQLRKNGVFNAEILEHITEFVVIVSVFSCGLKLFALYDGMLGK